MKTLMQAALIGAGLYLLWQQYGASLTAATGGNGGGAPGPTEATGPTEAGAPSIVEAAKLTAASALFRERLKQRAAQENRAGNLFTWWEWSWLYDQITGKERSLPDGEAYGLTYDTMIQPISFDQFWLVLTTGAGQGIGASLPGVAGLRRGLERVA